MLFKNLAAYRFVPGAENYPTLLQLQDALAQFAEQPIGALEVRRYGFVPPHSAYPDRLTMTTAPGLVLFCASIQEKVLPAAVINTELARQIDERERAEARKLGRKERQQLKDAILVDRLPKAFVRTKKVFGFWAKNSGWLVIDSSSLTPAEDILSLLRKGLGSLPVVPLAAGEHRVRTTLTRWLHKGVSDDGTFSLENEGELRAPEDGGAIIRYKHQDFDATAIANAIDEGMLAHKIAVTWNDSLNFVLDADLRVKRLKFLDVIAAKVAALEPENDVEYFFGDFVIGCSEIERLLNVISEVFADKAEDEDDSLG